MTIGEMLDKLLKLSTAENIAVQVDPARLRPSDVTLQIPCIDKFVSETGWKPEIWIDKIAEGTINRTARRKKLIDGFKSGQHTAICYL